MARVVIPYPLRKHTDNKRELEITGCNINEIIHNLIKEHSGLKKPLGALDFIAIFLNGERVTKEISGWSSINVKDSDEIAIILPIAGG